MTDILFNREDMRKLFREIRSIEWNEEDYTAIPPCQPGLFLGDDILFIGQNPGVPKLNENPTDETLLDSTSSDEVFHDAYKQSQFNWLFYKAFIKKVLGEDMNFSITNICFFPTLNNSVPEQQIVELCRPYLKRIIKLVNPKHIVVLGKIAESELKALGIDKEYNCIFMYHYAYLLRIGRLKQEIERVRGELK